MELLRRLRPRSGKDLYFLLIAFVMPIQSISIFRKGISIFDVVNVLILVLYLGSLVLLGRRVRWYLLLPMWIYLLGSVLGMFNSKVFGLNLYTLAQDLYLYVWFISLTLLITSERDVNYLTAAVVIGTLLVIFVGLFLPSGEINSREDFTFRNPNRAASYFMMAYFLFFAPAFRGRILVRLITIGLLVRATVSTGSVGAFLSFATGSAVMLSVYTYARRPGFWVPRQIALLMVAALVAYFSVAFDMDQLLQERFPLAFGRTPRSAETRLEIWGHGLQQFRDHPFGIGPASFGGQVESELGSRGAIELHSDYVAALVERGIVGFLGFLAMILFTLRFVYQMAQDVKRLGRADLALWVGALCGLMVGSFTYSLTHEALHHNSLWLSMALVMAQWQLLRAQRARLQRETQVRPAPSRLALPGRA